MTPPSLPSPAAFVHRAIGLLSSTASHIIELPSVVAEVQRSGEFAIEQPKRLNRETEALTRRGLAASRLRSLGNPRS